MITPTPPGSPKLYRVSTPLGQTLPIPPNFSPSVSSGQIADLYIPANSPTRSEISSIGGEVLPDVESAEPVLHSIHTVEPVSSCSNQNTTMEQAEKAIGVKLRRLRQRSS